MVSRLSSYLKESWGIPGELIARAAQAEAAQEKRELQLAGLAERNFLKVVEAFRSAGVSENHLQPSFGYGYFDAGRETLDNLFAGIFGGEKGLVRHQFVSGTHALRCALFGLLRPGDHLLVIPKTPYDTLQPVFGLKKAPGSLAEWGISVRLASVEEILSEKVPLSPEMKAVFIQRSKGYAWQDSISISTMEKMIGKIKSLNRNVKVIVDNCYGEFVEEREPCHVGADLVAGSLIKNPGGGIARTGGYLVGESGIVEQAAIQLTAPGLGEKVGATLETGRENFSGIFFAPLFVAEALKTSFFAAQLFQSLGYKVLPSPLKERTDTIQAIELGSRKRVLAFATGIQSAGPLEHRACPEGARMAGYDDEIVMSGGSFIQGGSLELSCDAPLRPPHVVYLQGGLSAAHGKLGVLLAAKRVLEVSE